MSTNTVSEVQTTQKEPERERRIFTFKATQLVWLFLGILEALLALRFVLKLIAANPPARSLFLYMVSPTFSCSPLPGLTGTPSAGGMVLEIPTMIAMVVYALIGWAIERMIWVIFYRPRGPVTQTTTTDQHTHQ